MLNVMIVDDEISHVQGLSRFIDWVKLGYAIPTTRESGEEALEELKRVAFDVLITDVSMPGMTGIELAAEAKRLHPHIQVLMISGYNEFEFVQDAIHVGAQAYALKPLKLEEVTERLQSFRSTIEKKREVAWHTRELEKKVSGSLRLIKERFVTDLITDAVPEAELLASWDSLLELPVLERGYQVLVVGLDHLQASGQEAKQRMLLSGGFKKTVEISFSDFDFVWLAQVAPDEFVVLHLNPTPSAHAKVEKQLQLVQSMMIDQCGATVTVGFSREGHDWQEAPLLYREIRLSMAKSRLVADGQIVRYDDLEPDAFNAYRLREEFVPGLLERIETGDQERVSEYMARIMDALLTPEPESFSYAQAFGMSLLSELIRNLKWRNKPQDDANILMWRQMLDCGSADQIAALLTDYVEHYMRTEKKAHLHQQHHLVQNISQFIRERLHENWTVKQLANHFNLNASYLSVLFKKETGKSISEFVQETRIQRAKELLQDPSIKVYEVAERVGIQTTAYFAYLFKKLVGSTPQDYRDYHYTPDESSYRP